MRVLFVGNSLIRDLPDRLARLSPPAPRMGILAFPGATLAEHAQSGRVDRELETGGWEVVLLQDASERALAAPGALRRDARRLNESARAAGAKTLLFATPPPEDHDNQSERVGRLYREIARELGAGLAPVAQAWRLARAALPDLALRLEDGLHPSPAGTFLTACVVDVCLREGPWPG